MKTKYTFAMVGALSALLLLAACATPNLPARAPGDKPDIMSDEAGFWMVMEEAEYRLATSGTIVRDPELHEYIMGILCRLTPDHCPDMRLYIVHNPRFNASMAPNGSMIVWTGLLLRTQNEAQLAAVIGHEIGHFVERHSAERMMKAKANLDAAAFFSLATIAVGVGIIGTAGQLAAIADVLAYGRDQEREADEFGVSAMARAGYEPKEAAENWRGLIAEIDAAKDDDDDQDVGPSYFSTHPDSAERMITLEDRAKALSPEGDGQLGEERFQAAIAKHRVVWVEELFGIREFKGNRVILDRLLAGGHKPGELHYFEGEFYRLRAEEGDDALAVAAYEKAIGLADAPAQASRALGLTYRRMGESAKARAAFARYLANAPEAEDRAMIEYEMKNL